MVHDGENGPIPSGTSVLDLYGSAELATQLGFFHMELFHATNELETIAQVSIMMISNYRSIFNWRRS